ncbi:MAG: 4Fe-4S dicluster domain-containing protein [Limnochordaceae bacterium]|nr:4Fe-4S dicluster domain-containing protein [Limnochordaceae bacterium]
MKTAPATTAGASAAAVDASDGRPHGQQAKPPSPAAVEKKLFSIRYRADEASHLSLADPELCTRCERPCLWFCPAAVYQWEDGHMRLAYENCLECGTCRIACPSANVVWHYPTGGCGIAYKRG